MSLLDILSNSVSRPVPASAIPCMAYPLVHVDDLRPVNLIAPGVNGPWIAGGAALQWYQGRPLELHDIDVFCAGPEQADQLCQRLAPHCSMTFQSNNATTYGLDATTNITDIIAKRWTVQVIKRRYFDSIRDVVNSFDITVCQIGMDGHEWVLGTAAAQDIRQQNLRMTLPLLPDAVKRLTKYWSYGYRPVPGLLKAIVQNTESRWTFDPAEDYNDAF